MVAIHYQDIAKAGRSPVPALSQLAIIATAARGRPGEPKRAGRKEKLRKDQAQGLAHVQS